MQYCTLQTFYTGKNKMNQFVPDIRPDYFKANYDKNKIAPYTLEDPLTFLNGSKVKNAADWQKRRREILDIFASEMYGAEPPPPINARGVMCDPNKNSTLPVNMLLAAGFAIVTASYCQVSPDPAHHEKEERFRQESFAFTGVFDLWGKRDPDRTDNITALGAWAWALSRGLDMIKDIKELDAKNTIVTGFPVSAKLHCWQRQEMSVSNTVCLFNAAEAAQRLQNATSPKI